MSGRAAAGADVLRADREGAISSTSGQLAAGAPSTRGSNGAISSPSLRSSLRSCHSLHSTLSVGCHDTYFSESLTPQQVQVEDRSHAAATFAPKSRPRCSARSARRPNSSRDKLEARHRAVLLDPQRATTSETVSDRQVGAATTHRFGGFTRINYGLATRVLYERLPLDRGEQLRARRARSLNVSITQSYYTDGTAAGSITSLPVVELLSSPVESLLADLAYSRLPGLSEAHVRRSICVRSGTPNTRRCAAFPQLIGRTSSAGSSQCGGRLEPHVANFGRGSAMPYGGQC